MPKSWRVKLSRPFPIYKQLHSDNSCGPRVVLPPESVPRKVNDHHRDAPRFVGLLAVRRPLRRIVPEFAEE